jgi:mannose-1-phosphate guanylyltransferase
MKRRWSADRESASDSRDGSGLAVMEAEGSDATATEPAPAARAVRPGDRDRDDPWVIVLAGGEGRRVQSFTTLPDGVTVPKQFCRFRDDRTLFGATLDRALRITRRDRVIAVVLEAHRDWWEPEVLGLPRRNVLSQPAGRGTAVAILHATVYVQLRDASARIVVMPSDHDFENEDTLARALRRAIRIADLYPDDLVLLGMAPSHLDPDYGLIVPGPGPADTSRPVRAFVEKPPLVLASRLIRGGALWNSFIFACTGPALYEAIRAALPALARGYLGGLASDGEPSTAGGLFEELPTCDFSRDVLQRNAGRLRLVTVPACGWTDLGTPARLAAWLDRHREAPFWRQHGALRQTGMHGTPGG